jgi:hypothetical protein
LSLMSVINHRLFEEINNWKLLNSARIDCSFPQSEFSVPGLSQALQIRILTLILCPLFVLAVSVKP